MLESVLEAKGINGTVELLEDRVLVRSQGFFGGPNEAEIPLAEITSLRFKKPGFSGGFIEFFSDTQELSRSLFGTPRGSLMVEFGLLQTRRFEALKLAVKERAPNVVVEDHGAGPPEYGDRLPEHRGPSDFHVWTFRGRAKKLAERHMNEDESIQFVIVGDWWQSIVGLEERVLVVKPGFMAGVTFGGRTTSFHYRDITGVEVNSGLMTSVIEILTPSYQGTVQKGYWHGLGSNKDKDPFQVSNCIPIQRMELARFKDELSRLRAKINEAKQVPPAPPTSRNDLSSELERLASLRASGALTDEEFQQAKKKLLS